MYQVFGNIACDYCQEVLNVKDYLIIKDKKAILHYCNEVCKEKHKNIKNGTN